MYPKLSFLRTYVWYPRVLGIKRFRILDLIDYNKKEAMEALKKEIEWQDYSGKHYESLFTRFFQGCYLPEKFGFDKRRAHLSSLVLSDQLSREQALEEMRKPPYPEGKLDEYRLFFLKKLGLTEEEWNDILKAPIRTYRDYPSSQWLFGDVLRSLSKKKMYGSPNSNPSPELGADKENHTSWERYYQVSDCSSSLRNDWYSGI